MTSDEIRLRFLKFFEAKGHKIMPSSSLIPTDSSVLFTTAGMQQFKPYYTNSEAALKDFGSKNVITIQKCVRTGDIDEVGDNTHLTFFEMLGNFSFGGYGRKEAIEYAHEFITKEMSLEISYVTIFKGQGFIKKDEESEKTWRSLGVTNIHEEGMEDLFWGPTGDSGPCGPTTETYCKNAGGEDVEIWNIVFNEYFCDGSREKLDKGEAKLTKLPVLGVDTGMGLERLVTVVNKKESVYETDLFNNEKSKEERIVADHIKASLFIISDDVVPSNTGTGYVLRRLMRSVSSKGNRNIEQFINFFIDKYKGRYLFNKEKTLSEFKKEREGYQVSYGATGPALINWQKENEFNTPLTGYVGFGISSTLGAKQTDILEKATELKISISPTFDDEFNKAKIKHQELSRTSSAGMFKGGLVNNNEKTIKLHTAHHLLLAGLQAVVDKNIKQKGSNITEERLRIDFICDHKLTDEEKQKVEDWIIDKIKRNLNVVRREMPLAEAEKIGAQMEFGIKYPEMVSVYFIEDENGNVISKEFCGGPHVEKTGELGHFKIQKEEAVSAGVRRIKATLV